MAGRIMDKSLSLLLCAIDNGDKFEAQAMVKCAIAAGRNLDPIPESLHIVLQAAAAKGHMPG